jgi:hypothetical protein
MSPNAARRFIVLVVVVAFAACSSTATISRNFGPAYEAEITGSDARSLRVRAQNGYEFVVPREDVTDIDHPGNVLLTIGAVVTGMYSPFLVSGLAANNGGQDEWSGFVTVMGVMGVAAGLSLALTGLIPYKRSKQAAAAFEDANPVLPVVRPMYFYPVPLPPPGGAPVPFAPPPPVPPPPTTP